MRTPLFALTLGSLLLCIALTPPASAHLSIIRQGAESCCAHEAGDRTGQELAAGDFNGDGYDDLAIGAPEEGVDGVVGAGAVIIMWGRYRGLDPAGTGILTISGRQGFVTDAQYGYALVAADFNGDGYDDLGVGAPGAAPSAGLNDAGMVYFYKGGPAGLSDWALYSQAVGGGAVEAGDRFGQSLTAGNFDGDASGYIDVAIGSPGENSASGAVIWLLSNGVNAPSFGGILQASDFGHTNDAGDQFGFALAAGNVLGGAEDDLIIGAPFKTYGAYNRAGVAYTKAGNSGGLSSGAQWILAPSSAGFPQADAHYGYAIAIGRFKSTASGHLVAAVGEPWRDISGSQKSGRVMLYDGGTTGLSNSPAVVDQSDAGGNVEPWDEFGSDLASGRFWDPADGWDDLAVGSPGDGFGFSSFAGSVNILHGGPNGPGNHGWSGFSQGTLNETVEANDELGRGLAFGRFDYTGYGHLVVGAPGEDDDAGLVHVIAPWRQTYNLSCRNSIVFDCAGYPIFSQKPYDQVFIASTTKILTVLIGCERLEAGVIQWDDEYIVPAWVANNIGGSQVPLYTGEKMKFWDMLNLCLHLSGNDAAHALADWMQGGQGPNVSLPAFVDEMNARAAQLGLTASHFNNPNGFEQEAVGPDKGDHYSTALDMAILSREAMKNEIFADIADELTYSCIRQFPVPNSPGSYYQVPQTITTFFNGLMQNSIQPAVGIKGGSTNAAQITGCFAAKNSLGTIWVAGSYYTPFNAPSNAYVNDAGNLLKIGAQYPTCGVLDFDIASNFYRPGWFNIGASLGSRFLGASEIGWGGSDDAVVEIGNWMGGDLAAKVTLRRISEHVLPPGFEILLGTGPSQGHGEMKFTNMGGSDAELMIYADYMSEPMTLMLTPNESMVLDPYDPGAMLPTLELLVMNNSPAGDEVQLSVEESYPFDLVLPDGGDPFRPLLRRYTGAYMHDSICFEVEGMTEPAAGKAEGDVSLYVTIQDAADEPGTDVPQPDELPVSGPVLRLYPAYPNPFQASTQIRFELHKEAAVDVAIFDARGRLVRELPQREFLPGRHQLSWDGRSGGGDRAAAGVYYYRVSAEGMPPSRGKLTIVR